MSPETRRGRKTKGAEQKAEGALKEAEVEVEKAARAVKHEVKRVEKAAKGARTPKVALARPTGRVPEATVTARHETGTITRPGRGFSLGELSGAGMAPRLAARWGVKVDPKRRSVLQGNISSLSGWRSHASAGAAVKKEAKMAEVRVEEAAKGAEVAVEVVEREAVQAEKAVKKEAKKAEAAVKRKVEKKPRPKKKESS